MHSILHPHREATADVSSFVNPVLLNLRENADDADPWGSAINAMFDLCEYMWATCPDAIDRDWQFRAGGGGVGRGAGTEGWNYDDHGTAAILAELAPDELDCIIAGRVIDRYTDMLRAAGHSY